MKIYPPDPITGLYAITGPMQVGLKWYARTLDYTASRYNESAPRYYQYLYPDLILRDYTDPNGNVERFYDTEEKALDVIRRYNLKSKLLIKKIDVYIPTEKHPLVILNKEDNSYRVCIKPRTALYYLQEDLIFLPKIHIFKTYQAALFAKLRYERIHQKDFQ
jgi:hypothetical protein